MKKSFFILLFLPLFMESCDFSNQESDGQSGKTAGLSSVDVAILENNQSYALTEKYRGDEKIAQLEDIGRSCYDLVVKESKVKLLIQAQGEIDQATKKIIKSITDLKTSTLKKASCKDCMVIGKGSIPTARVDAMKLSDSGSTMLEIKDLSTSLFEYARDVTSTMAGSQVQSDSDGNVQYKDKYSFELKKFKVRQPLITEIDQQLSRSRISPDDIYAIKDVLLEVLQGDFPTESISILDAINYLTIVERRILTARASAVSTIRYRVSG